MSRFAALSRASAAGVLILVAAAILWGLMTPIMPEPPQPVGHRTSATAAGAANAWQGPDVDLYRAIISRLKKGEPYESAAVTEQRARGFPLHPFAVVRPPALDTMLAWAPSERFCDFLLASLGLAVLVQVTWRLHGIWRGPWSLACVTLVVFSGLGVTMLLSSGAALVHECWAGLLIAASLAARTPKRYLVSASLGLLAALIREFAIPYLGVMVLFAVFERRRAEAAAFAAALVIASLALAAHACSVMALSTARDLTSEGWVRIGGWSFVLATQKWSFLVALAGHWMAALLVPLSLLGAIGWKDPAGPRLATLLAGFSAGFMIIGRPDNAYWGLLSSPLIAIGLCLVPSALMDLLARLDWRRGPHGRAAM